MFFTQNDLETIRNYIVLKGIKDSEFPTKNNISGEEWITIVDNGVNKKISTSFIQKLIGLTIAGTSTGTVTLGTVIESVDSLSDLDSATVSSGNLVYVKDEDAYYSYSDKNEWQRFLKVYVGSEEPKDEDVLWIDPEDTESLNSDEDETVSLLKSSISELEDRIFTLERITSSGVVPGDVASSNRRLIISVADPENPNEDSEDEDDVDKPDTSELEPTVPHNCCKCDTASNFAANKQDLVDGEMLFCTDINKFTIYLGGKFYTVTGSSDSSSTGSSGGLSVDDLYTVTLDYLIFSSNNQDYKARVDADGNWIVTPYIADAILPGSPIASWNNYISHLLCINSIFCGGSGSEEALVSHNFVELANGSDSDINLNGIYLLYTDGTKNDPDDIGYSWKVLPLEGTIKAGSTFVIRGAQCNTPKACLINVDSYDMEWRTNNKLITFNQGTSSFYLCAGQGYQELLNDRTLNNPWVSNSVKVGYIDSCGFGQGSVCEGSSTFLVTSDWNKVLFARWFMLEPAKQGNKAYASRKTTDLWTYIDLDKQTTREGNSVQYYYDDNLKQKFTPQASYRGKTFFTNKSLFDDKKPNVVNITFGIQATDNGSGATRCFNWISVGNYDEYLVYGKEGTEGTKVYSITANNVENSDTINKFIEHYQRLRWCTADGTWVTTHKVIVNGLTAGKYFYYIGRDGDNNYTSEKMYFTVHSDSEVKSFSFIQTTDLQGFNWAEYTAWEKSAYMINKNESNFNFTINTGDITQSGNRPNEWLDYYTGRQYLRDKEEMFTIGNNDLCGHVSTDLTDGEDATSKYNHINVLRYFTFELDPNNDNYSVEWNGTTYPIYSLYSFNYGDYHFVCLNSEIAIASSKMYKDWSDDTYSGDKTFAQAANAKIEDWFLKDLQTWSGSSNPTNCSKCIVYCHEMPFTIVTWSFMNGTSARAGSHLNTLNNYGEYRFSRLFKKYGIRLVIGGHKHTYCMTKPIYDAPDGYISNNTINSSVDFMGTVDSALSRKPVIQVTSASDVQTNDFARYEVVDKITAPVYVMSLATGYKLVSNKEQPSGNDYQIPWLMAYFKAKTNAASPTENVAQHRPMYIRYDLTGSNIVVTANLVDNVWNVNIDRNSKSFDMNNQLSTLATRKMTLDTTSEDDLKAYNITNIDSYTITL